jgi:hypothetical protein
MNETQHNSCSSRTDQQERQGSQVNSSSKRQPSSSQKIGDDGLDPFDDVTHWIGELR